VHLAALWRYPFKLLAGKPLAVAALTPQGVAGDRYVHVSSGSGPLTGRTRAGLRTLPAATSCDGQATIAGPPWDSLEALRLVRERADPTATLRRYDGPERFDITNLLVATDGAVRRFGHDVRRLRPNRLLGGADPEEGAAGQGRRWPSQTPSSASTRSANGASSEYSRRTPQLKPV
jgi:hypothetical protein